MTALNATQLRALIARTGLTQQECARALGIGFRTLQAYVSPTKPKKAPPYVGMALSKIPRGKVKIDISLTEGK